ncbi:MAG: S1 RNA-binding domain-containing protein [Chloroflexi bacterium]|nr:MAG: S1 RNA-binding domain-containing protein [Chloroflexota bacterium]
MENPVVSASASQELKPKTKFTGKVLKTSLAGAVIDIGVGKPAVIHVSQLVSPTGQAIKSVKEVLQEGQEVEVWVRKVKEDRIELTMLKPLDLDWHEIKKDMVVKGNVVRVETFGAFLEIGAERPGLIHISELAHGYVRTPGDVVKEGDELEAQVIDVNKKKKQIKLSLKALQPEPVKEEVDQAPEKSKDKRRKKDTKRKKSDEGYMSAEEIAALSGDTASKEAEPTFMEIAIREAMEKAKSRKAEPKAKKVKASGLQAEQEDLLARTLEKKTTSSQ